MFKLFFTLLFIYLAYRFLFVRPQLRQPYRQEPHPKRAKQQSFQQNARSKDQDDYVDYEEIE